jgi:hypothetical protein
MKAKFLFLVLLLFNQCASSSSYVQPDGLLKDSGGLTKTELLRAANKIGGDIIVHFKKNPNPNGVAVAILSTKNDTTEQISTDVFEEALVATLLAGKISTLRTDKRQEQLKEIKINQLIGGNLSAANLRSPNYFVKTTISEDIFTSSGDKIVQQILNTELINIETLGVDFSNKQEYTKKAVSNKGLGW